MDLHCPLTCGRCRTRRDMRISGQKIKMSDWGKLWSNKGKPQKLQCCRVQRESEIWNPRIFPRGIGNPVLWNSEYRSKIRIPLSIGIQNMIQVPLTKNPVSITYTWDPESWAWNPESKTVLDFPTWGELSPITVVAAAQNVQTITSCYWRAPVTLGNAYELVDIAHVYPTK